MRIAITTDGRNVSQQFGKCITFTIFEVQKGRARGKMIVDASASGGYQGLLYILKNEGVEVLLCGEISSEAKKDLDDYGIEVISGIKGNINAALRGYLRSRMKNI